jgi:hypothetical protein
VTDVKPETPEPAAPSAAKTEAEAPKGEEAAPSRDDKGRFAPKAEKPEAKPEPMVPLSALLAERAKRRDPEPQKPKTSVLDDEDKAISERITDHVNPLREAVFEMSIEFARNAHEDFDEVAQVFAQAANNDERLWAQMREAKNPAKYIYQVGKQFKELAPFGGDVVRYREHSIAEAKAELAKRDERINALAAELEALKKSKADLDAVPRSLNSAASGTQPTVAEADVEDIRKIVRFGSS